jgi:hypothetical protein
MPLLLTTASASDSELNTDKAITPIQSKLTVQDEAQMKHIHTIQMVDRLPR